ILNELNMNIKPINGAEASLTSNDLSVLDKFADAAVIGVGEATHGTSEFFKMKHRLFKYFVEKHGFKIFGFEADMGECIYIDRFICNNIGTIDAAMGKMHFWTWKTQEVKDLILWMKQYNLGKSENDKIHLLGVDCQYKDFNYFLVTEYLGKYKLALPENLQKILNDINQIKSEDISSYSTLQRETYKNNCDSIYQFFEKNKSQLISSSSEFEFKLIQRLLVQTKQFFDVMSKSSFNYRDKYMAENTIWLTELLGANTKVMQWAHNGHIAKDFTYAGSGSQGSYLSAELASGYKTIGFSFNAGSFRAVGLNSQTNTYSGLTTHTITKIQAQDSFNYLFRFTSNKNFILVNSDITPNTVLHDWLSKKSKFFSVGAVYTDSYFDKYYYEYNLRTTFDAIIHFNTTTEALAY
ncbi:MAG: erythromycin esterase family protein, partial [Ignavibacteria bacterium]|nr:erythromycin esterase family protein [Ignavibacteria bacterium]